MISTERIRSALASRLGVACVAVLVCLLGTLLRLRIAAHGVESPLTDENEVVEQAVAFMGGDLRLYFLKYGPLTMYALAAIYHVVAVARGMSPLEYASRVFFEGTEHYFIARAFVVMSLAIVTWFAYVSFRRQFGAAPALLVCSLLALPWFDVLYQGVRIDVVQGALQCAVLLTLVEVVAKPRKRTWGVAGALAGLAIAAKPLPGLLVVPCFFLASWFSASQRSDGSRRTGLARLGAASWQPGLWLAALACIGCAFLGNPSMLDLGEFAAHQQAAIKTHSAAEEVQRRSTLFQSISPLGLPFLITSVLAMAAGALRRDRPSLIVTLFLVVYLLAFWGRGVRNYFMVAPAMAACLLIGYAFANLYRLDWRRSRRWLAWAAATGVALLVAGPVARFWTYTAQPAPRAETQKWFDEHVPSGTPLVYVGRKALQIVGTDKKVQRNWGTHFEYGRHHYKFYKHAFNQAFTDYMASDKPRYPVVVHDVRLNRARLPRKLADSLLKKAQAGGQRYIIIAGFSGSNVLELGYRWFGEAILERQERSIAIFSVPPKPPQAEARPEDPNTDAPREPGPSSFANGHE